VAACTVGGPAHAAAPPLPGHRLGVAAAAAAIDGLDGGKGADGAYATVKDQLPAGTSKAGWTMPTMVTPLLSRPLPSTFRGGKRVWGSGRSGDVVTQGWGQSNLLALKVSRS
jgi:hypothetical protein